MNARISRKKDTGVDPGISIATALLISMGVVMSYSATAALALDSRLPPLFFDHLVGVAIGLAAAAGAYMLSARALRRLAMPFWLLTVGGLLATILLGVEVNGAQRWLEIPGVGFRFQPGELAKFATLLAVASWLSRKDDRRELSTDVRFKRRASPCSRQVFSCCNPTSVTQSYWSC